MTDLYFGGDLLSLSVCGYDHALGVLVLGSWLVLYGSVPGVTADATLPSVLCVLDLR